MSSELAAQGMMMDRETDKGRSLTLPVNSISTGFSLSQGNRQHHSEAPRTKLIYTRYNAAMDAYVCVHAITHPSAQSLWKDQLVMLITWKQRPRWSIRHSSIHDLFHTRSIQYSSRSIFLNSLDSVSCAGSTLFSIIRLCLLLLKFPPNFNGLGWHFSCQVFASGYTYTCIHLSVYIYNFGGRVRFHMKQFSCSWG